MGHLAAPLAPPPSLAPPLPVGPGRLLLGSGAARPAAAPAPGEGALGSRVGLGAEPTDTRVPVGAERRHQRFDLPRPLLASGFSAAGAGARGGGAVPAAPRARS